MSRSKASEPIACVKWTAKQRTLLDKHVTGSATDWDIGALEPLKKQLRAQLLKAQDYRCVYCRRVISLEVGHNEIDHVVAKSTKGLGHFTFERMNLAASCKRCNTNKHKKPVLAVTATSGMDYPLGVGDYVWVHPYIHRYSEHIRITEGMLFKAVGDVAHRKRGMAVIEACDLHTLKEVEVRHAEALAQAAASDHLAVLSIIGSFPEVSDRRLAKALRKARPVLKELSVAEVEALVAATRAGSAGAFRAMATICHQSRELALAIASFQAAQHEFATQALKHVSLALPSATDHDDGNPPDDDVVGSS